MAESNSREDRFTESYSIPFRDQMNIVRRIIKFASPYKWTFIIAITLGLIVSLTNVVLPRVVQILIDDYLAEDILSLQVLFIFAGLYFLISLVKAVAWFFNLYLYRMASEKTIKNIRDSLYEKIHTLGMRWFDQTSVGWIVTRVTNDTEAMKNFWDVFLVVIRSVFGIMTSIGAMLLLDVEVTLWILLFLPVVAIVAHIYQKYSTSLYQKIKGTNSILNTKLSESINGISIIQQFRQEKRFQDEFEEINGEHFQARFSMTKLNATLLSPVVDLFYALSIVVILGLFGGRSFVGFIEVGVIYAFTSYASNLFNPLTRLMDNLSLFQDGVISAERILRVVDADEYAPEQNEATDYEITEGKIEFDNVSFSYDDEEYVLHDITFTAEPGETVALVGQTGSGKSSIINILMRFYEFQKGEVRIDGRSIRDYPIEELRGHLGLVIQDPFLFYGTIKDNIRLYDESITDEEIRDAAEFVQADEFIATLDEGYDQRVSERGQSYSSGQRQLISFASTIAQDPTILILDEATANIDTETESLIQEGLGKMREGRTTIAIAHRLSTIRDANLILVLDHGRIVERGTHDELIEYGGIYKEMYELQNVAKS